MEKSISDNTHPCELKVCDVDKGCNALPSITPEAVHEFIRLGCSCVLFSLVINVDVGLLC